MSPEQTRGEPTDPRTDIFSLGIILFEAIAGRHRLKAAGVCRIHPHDLLRHDRPPDSVRIRYRTDAPHP